MLPASVDAFSIHDYRVRDAGDRIVHRVTVCDPYIRSAPLRLRSTHETAEGFDRQQYYTTVWMRRGCTRVGIWYPTSCAWRASTTAGCACDYLALAATRHDGRVGNASGAPEAPGCNDMTLPHTPRCAARPCDYMSVHVGCTRGVG